MDFLNFFSNDYFKLLLILKQHELKVNDERLILLRQEDLGKMMSYSRQTISKLLKELKNEEFIYEKGKNKLVITDKGQTALNFLLDKASL